MIVFNIFHNENCYTYQYYNCCKNINYVLTIKAIIKRDIYIIQNTNKKDEKTYIWDIKLSIKVSNIVNIFWIIIN